MWRLISEVCLSFELKHQGRSTPGVFGSQINLQSGLQFVHKNCPAPPPSTWQHLTCRLLLCAYKMIFLGRKHRGSTCYCITRIMTRTESEPLKPKESKAKALTPSIKSCLNPFRAFPHLPTAKLTTSLAPDFLKKLDVTVAGEGEGFCYPLSYTL